MNRQHSQLEFPANLIANQPGGFFLRISGASRLRKGGLDLSVAALKPGAGAWALLHTRMFGKAPPAKKPVKPNVATSARPHNPKASRPAPERAPAVAARGTPERNPIRSGKKCTPSLANRFDSGVIGLAASRPLGKGRGLRGRNRRQKPRDGNRGARPNNCLIRGAR